MSTTTRMEAARPAGGSAALVLGVLCVGCGDTAGEATRRPPVETGQPSGAAADSVSSGASASSLPTLLTAIDSLPQTIRATMDPWTGDLPAMAQRRVLRFLTVYEPQYLGFDGRRQVGLIAEAAAELETFLNERLDRHRLKLNVVILPVTRDLLIPFLEEGRGDIAAAGLTITPERLEHVDFTDPLATGVSEIVVTGFGVDAVPGRLEYLGELELHVRTSSSYWESLQTLDSRLRAENRLPLDLIVADEVLSDSDLLEMVNAGNLPATVVDGYQAEFWSQVYPALTLHPHLAVRTDGAIGWAFRKGSPVLRDALNDFVRQRRKGTLTGNILIRRYTEDTTRVRRAYHFENERALTNLSELFKTYAARYDLDWVLVAAQAFQESRFETDAVSDRGAVGIMQIKQIAADEVGVADISTTEGNIHAGAAYLRHLIDHYFADPDLDLIHRQTFAIAGYNAGPIRVRNLRRRAGEAGLDPDVWFDNVEVLAARELGSETVRYVSNVMKYYVTFSLMLEERELRQSRGR